MEHHNFSEIQGTSENDRVVKEIFVKSGQLLRVQEPSEDFVTYGKFRTLSKMFRNFKKINEPPRYSGNFRTYSGTFLED